MEPEKLSLKELLVRVPIGHLWGLIGVIASLVAGALWVGWSVRGAIEEPKIQQIIAEKSELERRIASLEQEQKDESAKMQQQEKANFLNVYLRYVMARDGLDQSIPLDAARKALDDYSARPIRVSAAAKLGQTP